MCLIIWRQAKQYITDEFLKDVWSRNDDGWGIMWTDKFKVNVHRGMDYESFIKEYRALEKDKRRQMVIHFRMATHGAKTIKNCHPFKVMDDVYLMHNGIISIDIPTMDKELSDTKIFVRDVLRPILKSVDSPSTFIRSTAFKHLMDSYCSEHSSRLTVMDVMGPVFFGGWFKTKKDLWVSNQYAYTVDNTVTTHYHKTKSPRQGGGGWEWGTDDYEWPKPTNNQIVPWRNGGGTGYVKPNRYLGNTPRCVGWHNGYYDGFHKSAFDLTRPAEFNSLGKDVLEYDEGYKIGYTEGVTVSKGIVDAPAKKSLNLNDLDKFYEAVYTDEEGYFFNKILLDDVDKTSVYLALDYYDMDEATIEATLEKIEDGLLFFVLGAKHEGTDNIQDISIFNADGDQLFPNYVPIKKDAILGEFKNAISK